MCSVLLISIILKLLMILNGSIYKFEYNLRLHAALVILTAWLFTSKLYTYIRVTQNVTSHLARVTGSFFLFFIILAYQISKTVIRVFPCLLIQPFPFVVKSSSSFILLLYAKSQQINIIWWKAEHIISFNIICWNEDPFNSIYSPLFIHFLFIFRLLARFGLISFLWYTKRGKKDDSTLHSKDETHIKFSSYNIVG